MARNSVKRLAASAFAVGTVMLGAAVIGQAPAGALELTRNGDGTGSLTWNNGNGGITWGGGEGGGIFYNGGDGGVDYGGGSGGIHWGGN